MAEKEAAPVEVRSAHVQVQIDQRLGGISYGLKLTSDATEEEAAETIERALRLFTRLDEGLAQ